MRCGWVLGGYTGWVLGTGWVQGRAIPVPSPQLLEEGISQRSGPVGPARAGVVGIWPDVLGTAPAHPCGARSVPVGPPLQDPRKCRLWANKARFNLISSKVSQNGEVSSESVQKASHSPCFQNGLQKSPLEIPRFPVSRAFSHKELMGRFDAWSGLYCQNDEVSPSVHT